MVEAFRGSEEHSIGIAVYTKEARTVSQLNNGLIRTVSIADSAFFKYTIDSKSDLERLNLLLNVSNRKNLQVFISKKQYPTEIDNENIYSVGDVPDRII